MNLLKKINYLNEKCNGSLSITRYGLAWKVESYGKDSRLSMADNKGGRGETLEAAVEDAMQRLQMEG